MRVNKTLTISAEGAINLVNGLTAVGAAGIGPQPRVMARSLFVQMIHGGTGRGLVLDGIYGVQDTIGTPRIPSAAVASDVTAELAPATATSPGGSYSDNMVLPNGAAGIQVDKTWVDGTVPGDLVKVSYDTITP